MRDTRSSLSLDPTLVWIRVSPWFVESECRRYACRRYYPGDVLNEPGEARYQMSCRGTRIDLPQGSFDKAAAIAEAHVDFFERVVT